MHLLNIVYFKDGPFAWSKSTQGFILSSYFYGYIITQVSLKIKKFKYFWYNKLSSF